jgi:predicted nucleic acid-binding protein
MRVIDTSIWIEIFLGSELGRQHLPLLDKPEDIIVPTIVQYEIYKWLARERTAEEANRVITFTADCTVQDMDSNVAILAAELAAEYKLHTTDAIIYASALVNDASVLTCDAHFNKLPGVEYFEKTFR